MRIIVFGTGVFCENRINCIENKVEIVAFIDNNASLWGKKKKEVFILSPSSVKELQYDRIILMSISCDEMKKQLLNMGIEEEKISYFEEFYAEIRKGELEIHFDNVKNIGGKKVLITVYRMTYGGIPVIALNTARALQQKGYQVVIAAVIGNKEFIRIVTKEGILVYIYGGLFDKKIDEIFWIHRFDYVIVNSCSMMKFAMRLAMNISSIKPCFFWIHEPTISYKCRYKEANILELCRLNIFAVSEVAKRIFEGYYPNSKVKCLEYGITDKKKNISLKKEKNKLIFAIIGHVHEIKGQDILLEAVRKLNNREKNLIEIWIIGKISENSFCQKIKAIAKNELSVRILGEFNRYEMEKAYSEIDVVVNASRQDVFPTVVAEGMMYGKVCITTDITGMAPLISDGENGFVCKSENAEDLCEKITWILSNKELLDNIGENARLTYLRYFTIEGFGDRLDKIISSNTI